jgi:hypothetical protein
VSHCALVGQQRLGRSALAGGGHVEQRAVGLRDHLRRRDRHRAALQGGRRGRQPIGKGIGQPQLARRLAGVLAQVVHQPRGRRPRTGGDGRTADVDLAGEPQPRRGQARRQLLQPGTQPQDLLVAQRPHLGLLQQRKAVLQQADSSSGGAGVRRAEQL